jgi:hypothetical protein
VLVWHDTLARLDRAATGEALRDLRMDQDFFPTHHQLAELSRSIHRRRTAERELPAPLVCRCGGTGWHETNPAGQGIVERCGCGGRPSRDDSPMTAADKRAAIKGLAELREKLPFLVRKA